MKVFLIILLILLLLTVLLCLSSAVASVRYWDGAFEWNVKYLGIRLLPRPKKPKKEKKKKDDKDEPPEDDGKPLRKKFLMDKLLEFMQNNVGKLDLAGSGIAALPGPLQMLLRSVIWSDIQTDIVIGGEDAAKTAQQYGMVEAGLKTIIGASAHVIRVKRKDREYRDIHVRCDFTADKSRWDFACKCKVQVGPLLGGGIWLLWKFLMDSRKAKKQIVSDVL